MKVAVFSAKSYDQEFLDAANTSGRYELNYLDLRLNAETAQLAKGAKAVSVFINDDLSAETLQALHKAGCRMLALRSAGFNHVDLKLAAELDIQVFRVPAYSPYAVAEHALALIMTLNRKIHRAYNRTRDGNFSIEGLLGFDMHGRTAGIIGTGKIGYLLARILSGMGCHILGYDPTPNPEFFSIGGKYESLSDVLRQSDILSLHCPLTPETHHLIDEQAVATMREGVMLINTSRGALVDTAAVTEGLKSGKIGYLGLDVYEQEEDLFFEDLSEEIIQDDRIQRLLMFPNVVVTSHQAYFTRTALANIAQTTLENIQAFEQHTVSHPNQVHYSAHMAPEKNSR